MYIQAGKIVAHADKDGVRTEFEFSDINDYLLWVREARIAGYVIRRVDTPMVNAENVLAFREVAATEE